MDGVVKLFSSFSFLATAVTIVHRPPMQILASSVYGAHDAYNCKGIHNQRSGGELTVNRYSQPTFQGGELHVTAAPKGVSVRPPPSVRRRTCHVADSAKLGPAASH